MSVLLLIFMIIKLLNVQAIHDEDGKIFNCQMNIIRKLSQNLN